MSVNGLRILIVDDETQIRRMLKVALTAHGYDVSEAATGQEGVNKAALFHPDLIVLDLGLPDMDGADVIQSLREWTEIPILILSVREHEDEKIKTLDWGADDYITKPFNMGELLARIRVALRHVVKSESEPVLTFGDLTIDLSRRLVTEKGRDIKLTPLEYDILKNLALNAGRVLTHRYLLRNIWGIDYQDETHYLRVYIGQLRRKIEPDPTMPKYIVTEPGIGYRLAVKD